MDTFSFRELYLENNEQQTYKCLPDRMETIIGNSILRPGSDTIIFMYLHISKFDF